MTQGLLASLPQPWLSLLAGVPVVLLVLVGMNLPKPPWDASPVRLGAMAAVGLVGVWLIDGRLLAVVFGLLAFQRLPFPGESGFLALAGLALASVLALLFVDWRLPGALLALGLVVLGCLYWAYHNPQDTRWFGSWTGQQLAFAVLYPQYMVATAVVRLLAPWLVPAAPLSGS